MLRQAKIPILLVDNDLTILYSTQLALESVGIGPVETLTDSRQVMQKLAEFQPQIVLMDLSMPHISGRKLLPEIRKQYPDISVIIITDTKDVDTAIACIKEGAVDFLTKPMESSQLVSRIGKAMELRGLHKQLSDVSKRLLTGRLDHPAAFSNILTSSPKMIRLFQYMESISNTQEPVLITGETGVGKELMGQALHYLRGKDQPLVIENVAGLDDSIFSDSLFGHVKGAFTGADTPRQGLVEKAGNGTLVLDEIGDLSPDSQIKLLRLIQERTYTPLGSDDPKPLQARILLTTHRDIEHLVAAGEFRQDLYYRLNTHKISIPPLRERREDLELLLPHFIKEAARSMDKFIPSPPTNLPGLLSNHHFSGNIRELRGMVFDAAAQYKGSGPLPLESFHTAVKERRNTHSNNTLEINLHSINLEFPEDMSLPTLKEWLKDMEQLLIEQALKRASGNQSHAASLLGLSRQAFYKRSRKP